MAAEFPDIPGRDFRTIRTRHTTRRDHGPEQPEVLSVPPGFSYDLLLPVMKHRTGFLDRFDLYDFVLVAMVVLLIGHAGSSLLVGLNRPILDFHGFRQTQTAIAALSISKGGPWFAYETPVFGEPWSAPFELPIYQWCVAILHSFGAPLIPAGRIVSFLFFIAILWPLAALFKTFAFGRQAYLVASVLLLASPQYIFWSRTVLIESCALFLGTMWLALLTRYLICPARGLLAAAVIVGVLAINAKSTTFATFGLLGAAIVGWKALLCRRGASKCPPGILALALFALVIPFCSGVAWVRFTDHIKAQNQVAVYFTSANLTTWNYGTLAQRVSGYLWQNLLFGHMISNVFGYTGPVALVALGASSATKRLFWPAVVSACCFMLPLLLFTNLHMKHPYYQYANAIFVLTAAAFGVSSLAESGRPYLAGLLLLVLAGGELAYYRRNFAPLVVGDQSSRRAIQLAPLLKRATTPDETLFIIGDSYSSEIPFYSDRRALMLPDGLPDVVVKRVLSDPQAAIGARKLGAVVFCPEFISRYGPSQEDQLRNFAAPLPEVGQAAGCSVLAPPPGVPAPSGTTGMPKL